MPVKWLSQQQKHFEAGQMKLTVKCQRHKCQCIYNNLVYVVTNLKKFAHVTLILTSCLFKTCIFITTAYVETFPTAPLNLTCLGCSCSYNTRCGCPDWQYLAVPAFQSVLQKSVKHFGHSFAFDAPKIWKNLPVCKKAYPP